MIAVKYIFGEIYPRWGILQKVLACLLVNFVLFIEGVACLHNFLQDYNGERSSGISTGIQVFHDDHNNNGTITYGAGDYCPSTICRCSNIKKNDRFKGLHIKDWIMNILRDYGLSCPKKNRWYVDKHTLFNIKLHLNFL